MVRSSFSTASATSSRVGLTKTPATSQRRFIAWPISAAWAGSTRRGLRSQWFSPIAQAPSSTARSASSRRVTPQIFTLVINPRVGALTGLQCEPAFPTPRGLGNRGGLGVLDPAGSVAELHGHLVLLVAAEHGEGELVAGIVVVDRGDHLVHA